MVRCVTKKKMYQTESAAEDALIAAWETYDYKGSGGPVGVYFCDNCGTYHLTSKGEMNKRLAEAISSGSIQRQAEANRWSDKFKKKG